MKLDLLHATFGYMLPFNWPRTFPIQASTLKWIDFNPNRGGSMHRKTQHVHQAEKVIRSQPEQKQNIQNTYILYNYISYAVYVCVAQLRMKYSKFIFEFIRMLIVKWLMAGLGISWKKNRLVVYILRTLLRVYYYIGFFPGLAINHFMNNLHINLKISSECIDPPLLGLKSIRSRVEACIGNVRGQLKGNI